MNMRPPPPSRPLPAEDPGRGFAAHLAQAAPRALDVLLDAADLIDHSGHDAPGELVAALQGAGADGRGVGTVAPGQALALAVARLDGKLLVADGRFDAALRAVLDAPAVRRLLRTAEGDRASLGLVEDAEGALAVLWAGSAALARRWPLTPALEAALAAEPRARLLVAFAPARSSSLARAAAAAYGLSRLEARLAEAFLEAPSLAIAAQRLGVGLETARDAFASAKAKLGVHRSTELVSALTALMAGAVASEAEAGSLESVLGLTPAEARVAAHAASGLTAPEVASRLEVKVDTVKGHLKTAFAKTGVSKAKDLGRLVVEARALETLSNSAEVVAFAGEDDAGALRVIPVAGERRAAFIDYGPREGRPFFVFHGFAAGRRTPPGFVAALQARGWRPIAPQRPGFGLTDPAPAVERFADVAADDMAAILDALKRDGCDALGRDCGAPALFAFGGRHGARLGHAVLTNPHAPRGADRAGKGPLAATSRFLMRHPQLIAPYVDLLRRHTKTEHVERILLASLNDSPSDISAVQRPEVRLHLVRDIQALTAHTGAGVMQEQALYAGGWAPPETAGGARWTVAHSAELRMAPAPRLWGAIAGVSTCILPAGGLLSQYTHPDLLAELARVGPAAVGAGMAGATV